MENNIISHLTLMDDIMMKKVFKSKACTKLLINVILDRKDIDIISHQVQSDTTNVEHKSIIMDILAEDSNGTLYNIEIQKDNQGADPKRARYHSSMLDIHILEKGKTPKDLKNTYVIFITQNDVLKQDKMIYHIDRVIRQTGQDFGDGSKIIYVNTSKQDDTDLGKLVRDLKLESAEDMYYEELKEECKKAKTEYIIKGGKKMNKLLQEYREIAIKEGMQEGIKEGMQEGIKEGRDLSDRDYIKKMYESNIDMALIERISGYSKQDIEKIINV